MLQYTKICKYPSPKNLANLRLPLLALSSFFLLLIFLLLLLFSTTVLTGCKKNNPATEPDNTDSTIASKGIVVSIFPIYDLVKQLTTDMDDIKITLLLKPGISPHGYQPTPADAVAIRNAHLLIINGGEVDSWIEPLWKSKHPDNNNNNTTSDAQMISLLNLLGIQSNNDPTTHDHDIDNDDTLTTDTAEPQITNHDNHSATNNPHQWLVPHNAQLLINTVSTQLQKIYPQYTDKIKTRQQEIINQLDTLDKLYQTTLKPVSDRRIITFHDSFSPLADEYNLQVVATIFSIQSEQVTAARLHTVQQAINNQKVNAVFIEPQFNADAARRLSSQNVTLRILDPIGDPNRKGYTTYFEMMESNLKTLYAGLMDNNQAAANNNKNSTEPGEPENGGG